jgi:hypothetical protein
MDRTARECVQSSVSGVPPMATPASSTTSGEEPSTTISVVARQLTSRRSDVVASMALPTASATKEGDMNFSWAIVKDQVR